ncbi:hypothetical protein RDABS01_011568, partial [Bienertia sinuspersici]
EERLSMELSLKPCTSTCTMNVTDSGSGSVLIDRLTTLPAELLIGILSLLPTKDVVVASLSCKRMMCVFRRITRLDFDDSPAIYHFQLDPYKTERLPTFVTFVDSVLQAYQSEYLTKFRLGVSPVLDCPHCWLDCPRHCLPDLKSTLINSWISLPLTRYGLRELDLRIHLRGYGDMQLPSEIFTCETLEVLKLDVNLGLDRVAAMPSFHLPNLKLAVIGAIFIPKDGLLIDDLALRYSITNIDCLVKAYISIRCILVRNILSSLMIAHQRMIDLIRPFSNVQHLVLDGHCIEELSSVKDQLPLFSNLKCLELCYYGPYSCQTTLLAFLSCSPVLETLLFPKGSVTQNLMMSEPQLSKTDLSVIPSCCRHHLKRIEINKWEASRSEIDLIQFILRTALVLEELVVFLHYSGNQAEFEAFESALQNLPRASVTCSIQVVTKTTPHQ